MFILFNLIFYTVVLALNNTIFKYFLDFIVLIEDNYKIQKNHYSKQKEQLLKLKYFKHDYNNIMISLKYLIKINDMTSIKNMLNIMDTEITSIQKLYTLDSNNYIIESIIHHKENDILSNNIDFSAKVYIPDEFILSDFELCRIFGNLLDNSIEACNNITSNNHKYIRIQSSMSKNWFSLIVENSFSKAIKSKNSELITNKSNYNDHGNGIKIVNKIIISKDGFTDIKIDNNNKVFRFIINLPL